MTTSWVIYDHPSDYPNHYVVRSFQCINGKEFPSKEATLHDTIEDARKAIPAGLCNFGHYFETDPVILEVWM